VIQSNLPENMLIIGPLGKQTNCKGHKRVFTYGILNQIACILGLFLESKVRIFGFMRHSP
jgi:hypothetical protein